LVFLYPCKIRGEVERGMFAGMLAIKMYMLLVAIVVVTAAGWYLEQMTKESA